MTKITRAINRPEKRLFRILGLMSGTSMDGIDVALLETDGRDVVRPGAFMSVPYQPPFRKRLRSCLGKKKPPATSEAELTRLHADAVKRFLKKYKMRAADIDALGFHGHTILHAPEKGITVQMGDGTLLHKLTSIPVVYDFRSDDVKKGGQGAPLVPVYHKALSAKWEKPCVFLNIGGVANLTFIDKRGNLLACDTGPGNALMDDWVMQRTGKAFDKNGALAAKGRVDEKWVRHFLKHKFFRKEPPKSIDRDMFGAFMPHHLNTRDGAATLNAMTVQSIAVALKQLPQKTSYIVVCGGGRKNRVLMKRLEDETGLKIILSDAKKLNGDALEAQAFAYLAARVILRLPITFPGTTGVKA
jgi:anhydro-N-acetylmuramic acid kinase